MRPDEHTLKAVATGLAINNTMAALGEADALCVAVIKQAFHEFG
jgi:hypothetical protein